MTDFAVTQVADGEPGALAEALAAKLEGFSGHNLGFLYVTNPLAGSLDEIVSVLKSRSGIGDWVGTVGFGICATGREYFDRPAITALTGRFDGDAYRMIASLAEPDAAGAIAEPGFVAGLGVVHGDPRNPLTADIVSSLAHDNSTFLVGGLSSAERAYPQVAGDVVDGGVSGVLLGGALNIAVGLTQGCSPIGAAHQVTRGERSVLATLDNRPAYEVLMEDLGVAEGADPRPWLSNIHVALLVPGSDMADYLVRNLMAIDPTQGLIQISDEIAAGERLMFVRRDAEAAAKDLRRMLDDLQARISAKPRAGLYFSCVARGPNLFADDSHELKEIGQAFGEIPIAGFFGNGEISNDRVYGYTGVLTLFL